MKMNIKQIKHQKGFTLIELLVVIGILAVLMGIVLVAINPSRQFNQANNSKRSNDVRQILNALGNYLADNKGVMPAGMPAQGAAAQNISKSGADLCSVLVPTYISALPEDPSISNGTAITDCSSNYDSGYQVSQDTSGRITVTAIDAALGAIISVTR